MKPEEKLTRAVKTEKKKVTGLLSALDRLEQSLSRRRARDAKTKATKKKASSAARSQSAAKGGRSKRARR